MELDELTRQLLGAIAIDDAMQAVAAVSQYDRYQASRGIGRAAELVADLAVRSGLKEVEVIHYPATGERLWWTFDAPRAWTPHTALLEARLGGRSVWAVDHARAPFSLATYSCGTTPNGIDAPFSKWVDHDLAGAIVLAEREDYERDGFMDKLRAQRARGFVTAATARVIAGGPEHVGRIELRPNEELFGFSVTPAQFTELASLASAGAVARATIVLDAPTTMPVVTGRLESGQAGPESWLTAHLCHPRPGANDNASGVAGLLGVAAALTKLHRAGTPALKAGSIRFIWGPEYLGVASFLHKVLGKGGPLPQAVINMDMVGEDQERCRCPFILERNPDTVPSLIAPLGEAITQEVFRQTRRGGGTWRAAPFMGFSDHALFADPSIARPAIQLCHAPDIFNHSAGDTLDKVSPLEMRRSIAVAAGLAAALSWRGPFGSSVLRRCLDHWCSSSMQSAQAAAQHFKDVDHGGWSRRLIEHTRTHHKTIEALTDAEPTPVPQRAGDESPLRRTWQGPFNARAMLLCTAPETQARVTRLIQQDKQNLAYLLNLAIRVNDQRSRAALIEGVSMAFERPLPEATVSPLLDALVESKWVCQS